MAKIVVIDCDRCGERIRSGKKKSENERPLIQVVVTHGDKVKRRDLCTSCEGAMDLFLRGIDVRPQGEVQPDDTLMQELRHTRDIANKGIEAYADGATAAELVVYLRDTVSSAARRS